MAEHLPYYGHEQGCYNSKIPWGPEPCSGCVSLRRAFSQGQRDEREACIALVETVAQSGADIDYVEIDSVIAAIRARSDGGES